MIYGKLKTDIAKILSMLCKRKGVRIVEAEMCPDHVHMLVEIPPSISVSSFVGAFCGAQRTSMRFRADAVQSITDALNRLLLWINFWAGSLQYSA